jgi:hypothetical protein
MAAHVLRTGPPRGGPRMPKGTGYPLSAALGTSASSLTGEPQPERPDTTSCTTSMLSCSHRVPDAPQGRPHLPLMVRGTADDDGVRVSPPQLRRGITSCAEGFEEAVNRASKGDDGTVIATSLVTHREPPELKHRSASSP